MNAKKCSKCGSYTYEHDKEERHGFINLEPCPDMTDNEIKENLIQYFKIYQEHSLRESNTRSFAQLKINKAKKETELWKGKYLAVKHENNLMRKKHNTNLFK